jgi:hypothetical protein
MDVDSEVTFGSTLVPEERNPTEFSITAMPGILVCARTTGTTNSKHKRTITFISYSAVIA